MSNVKSQQSSLSQSNGAAGSSRAALALAVAQQAAAHMKQEKKQEIEESIELLHKIRCVNFVWMVFYDNTFHYTARNNAIDQLQLLLNIKGCSLSSMLANFATDENGIDDLSDLERAEILAIEKPIDDLVHRLESSGVPYAMAAGFNCEEGVYFKFGQLTGPEAAGYLLCNLMEEACFLNWKAGGPVFPN